MTIRVTTEHGIDVTEGVQAAYDLTFTTMNWASNFFSVEDLEPLIRLGIACGYDLKPMEDYMLSFADPRYVVSPEVRERARAQIEAIRQEMQQ